MPDVIGSSRSAGLIAPVAAILESEGQCGTGEDDHFDAPLLDALAALFGQKDDQEPPQNR